MEEILRQLPQVLLPWYDAGHRKLPWREDREPYHVWLSEIMLQQTRVEAVKGYYARFLQALPTVQALADCQDDRLHKLWEGLGYYSRVRNLKKAAGVILEKHGGEFPRNYEAVLALPGIGEYTAGAVCSICFDLPVPAVDGNVLRVAARLLADASPVDQPAFKKKITSALAQVYPARAGDFTQALMELGATLCGPNRKPDCESCPCKGFCLGYQQGIAERLPVRLPRQGRRQEEKTVFILRCHDRFALLRRQEKGLLAGLWQFPDVAGLLEAEAAAAAVEAMGLCPREIFRQTEKTHVFTHVQWNMRGFYMETAQTGGDFAWLTGEQITNDAALPTAYRQFWEGMDHV